MQHFRNRLLLAVGIPVAAIATTHCQPITATTVTVQPSAHEAELAQKQPHPSDAGPQLQPQPQPFPPPQTVREPLPNGAWSVRELPIPGSIIGMAPSLPTCPNGEFCVHAPQTVSGPRATAPHQNCALSTVYPTAPNSREGMPRSVSFNPDRTTSERSHASDACCYRWVVPCPGGRPLRNSTRENTFILATSRTRNDWLSSSSTLA